MPSYAVWYTYFACSLASTILKESSWQDFQSRALRHMPNSAGLPEHPPKARPRSRSSEHGLVAVNFLTCTAGKLKAFGPQRLLQKEDVGAKLEPHKMSGQITPILTVLGLHPQGRKGFPKYPRASQGHVGLEKPSMEYGQGWKGSIECLLHGWTCSSTPNTL